LALALAPKSNSVTRALGAATAAVQAGGLVEVPDHLRDSHYSSAASMGFGEGYAYPHDYPGGWVDQTYLPASLVGTHFYEPSDHGREDATARNWHARKGAPGPARVEPPVE
jgi:putative ATPase